MASVEAGRFSSFIFHNLIELADKVMEALTAVHISVSCAALGVLETTSESIWLSLHGDYGETGIWPWSIVRECYSTTTARFLSPFASTNALLAIFVGRIIAAVALLYLYVIGNRAIGALIFLVLTHFLISLRNRWGGEGGDQMTTIILVSGLLADLFSGDSIVATYAALFVGSQITLAYFASGFAKLLGPLWRRGVAIQQIMNNHSHGHPWLSERLKQFPQAGRVLCFLEIAFQLSFVLFFFLPTPIAFIYPTAGLLFHFGIAYFMRLNLFCFVFIGTYPCLIYTREFARTALS